MGRGRGPLTVLTSTSRATARWRSGGSTSSSVGPPLVTQRRFEIEFFDSNAAAYDFTFGCHSQRSIASMRSDIAPGGTFPDYALPDHTNIVRKLSDLQGSDPLILTLARGHYCPKEHQQHLQLAT